MSSELITSDGEIIQEPSYPVMPAGMGGGGLSAITARDTGGRGRQIETTVDLSTPEGKMQVGRHLEFNPTENAKTSEGWYGTPFNLVAVTSRAVLAKKGPDGVAYAEPKLLVRTVMEADDGRMLASSSSYVYESLQEIFSLYGKPSPTSPIRVRLGKGGSADKMFSAFDAQKVNGTPAPAPKTSKK